FAFGEGVPLPARVKLNELPTHLLPKSEAMSGATNAAPVMEDDFLANALKRWRSATIAQHPDEDTQAEPRTVESGTVSPLQPASAAEHARPHLRRRQDIEAIEAATAVEGEAARLPHN